MVVSLRKFCEKDTDSIMLGRRILRIKAFKVLYG